MFIGVQRAEQTLDNLLPQALDAQPMLLPEQRLHLRKARLKQVRLAQSIQIANKLHIG